MKAKTLLSVLGLAQMLLALRVVKRLLATARGVQIQPALLEQQESEPLSIIVPVLNEYERLIPCLEGLLQQGHEVTEVLFVDGGSQDGTQTLIGQYVQRDPRMRLLDASPVPADWNGKCWGLHTGLQQIAPNTRYILTLDADVQPAPLLARSLLNFAREHRLAALSVATLQEIAGIGQGLLHPALLTTLVYRFGSPGHAASNINAVQANGQCFLCQRDALAKCGGFAVARASLCEDITIARTLVAAGYACGFYETDHLISVEMYRNWQETWSNWTRSLPMRDRFSGRSALAGWLEIALVQALPLPLLLLLATRGKGQRGLLILNGLCLAMRIGVLFGTARAYRRRPWSYWLSPLCDLPVAAKLGISALQRQHTWRGRPITRGGLG